jgi:hypothetical protein
MASVRFLGREIQIGSNDPAALQLDSNQGRVLDAMVTAALPETYRNQKQLQQAKAAQAKQLRDEARAIAKQFNVIVEDKNEY